MNAKEAKQLTEESIPLAIEVEYQRIMQGIEQSCMEGKLSISIPSIGFYKNSERLEKEGYIIRIVGGLVHISWRDAMVEAVEPTPQPAPKKETTNKPK